MRIIFMGTPEFAAKSLNALLDANFDICGVYTRPDTPKNRGMKRSASPVKELALENGLKVFQPQGKFGIHEQVELESLSPDIITVVAYGRILPESVLNLPKYGCINVHASLLPKYRGAAPIQRAVLQGEEQSGVTTMYISNELDAGDIIYSRQTEIGEFETSGELFERLAELGAQLLVETVRAIENGSAPRIPQDPAKATFAPMLEKEMSAIDWNKSPREIVKHICGLDPWPVASTELGGMILRVFGAEYTENRTNQRPGSVISANREGLEVACGGGQTLRITKLQAPGGKRMGAGEFLRGHPILPAKGEGNG